MGLRPLGSLQITHTTTVPHTPQHNGIVERFNRTLMEAARTSMQHAKAPMALWEEAAKAAVFTWNLTLLRKGVKETPEGMWHSAAEKPSVENCRVAQ